MTSLHRAPQFTFSSVSLRDCAMAAGAYAAGLIGGLYLIVALSRHPGGIGYDGVFIITSPIWLSTVVPAAFARVFLESRRTRPSPFVAIFVWVAGGLATVEGSLLLVWTFQHALADVFLPDGARSFIVVAYGISAPFLIPLVLAVPFTSSLRPKRTIAA